MWSNNGRDGVFIIGTATLADCTVDSIGMSGLWVSGDFTVTRCSLSEHNKEWSCVA